MDGMTVQQRLDDICKRSGMSEDIVRRVLQAERAQVLEQLKRGERATLIGRCVLRPDIRSKIVVGGQTETYIKANADVAYALQRDLQKHKEFINDRNDNSNELPEGIKIVQLSQLL